MPREATFKVKADRAATAKSFKEAGEAGADELSAAMQRASEMGAKHFETILGKGITEQIGKEKLQTTFLGAVTQLGRDSKVKTETKRTADSLSKILGKEFGESVKSQDVRQMLQRVQRDIETSSAVAPDVKREGYLGKLMWGERGYSDFKRQMGMNLRTIGDTVVTGVLRHVGLQNLIPNMQRMGGGGGLGRAAGGVVGGMALTGAQVGMRFLGGAIDWGLGARERAAARMVPFMPRGGAGFGRALGWGRAAGFRAEETAGILAPAFRAGIDPGASRTLLRSARMGIGEDLTGLLGGMVQRGERVGRGEAKRAQIEVLATGVATGLERGRWGEIARGMAALVTGRGIGVTARPEDMGAGYRAIRRGFRGQEATQALLGMEALAQGGRTPVGRALGLMQSGLGGVFGGDIFAAERRMELGIFGKSTRIGKKGGEYEYGGIGMEGLQGLLGRYKGMFGFGAGEEVGMARGAAGSDIEMRRGGLIKTMAMNMGLTQNATEKLLNAMERGVTDQEELNKIVEGGKPIEEQAFKAIIRYLPKTMLLANIEGTMENLYGELLPLIRTTLDLLNEVLEAVRDNSSILGTVATGLSNFLKGKWGGIFGESEEVKKGHAAAAERAAESTIGKRALEVMERRTDEGAREARSMLEFFRGGGQLRAGEEYEGAGGFQKLMQTSTMDPKQRERFRQAFTEGGKFQLGQSDVESFLVQLRQIATQMERRGEITAEQRQLILMVPDERYKAEWVNERAGQVSGTPVSAKTPKGIQMKAWR